MYALIQRKIFLEIIKLFLISVTVLLLIIIISRAVQMRNIFIGLELGPLDTILLMSCMIPILLMLTIPIGCMLSVFLTFLRMSTDKELIALRAGGISIYQLLPAPITFSILCLLLTTYISLFGLAWGMDLFRTTLIEYAQTKTKISLTPGIFNTHFPKITIFAKQIDPITGELKQVIVGDQSRENQNLIILAPKGILETNPKKGDLIFKLTNGKIYTINTTETTFLIFDEYMVQLPVEALFKSFSLGDIPPREMPWKELLIERNTTKDNTPYYQRKINVEIHKRWAYPMACLALTVFALPLAVVFEGIHRQSGFILALVMFFIYYSLMSLGFSMSETGTIPPSIGLWVPNILFLLVGMYGIYLTAHERTPHILYLMQWTRRRLKKVSE